MGTTVRQGVAKTGASVVMALTLVLAATPKAIPALAADGPDFPISSGTSSGGAFGPTIGLDFRSGSLHAAWSDNAITAAGDFDIATARIAVTPAGAVTVGPTVNVSQRAGNQAGASLAIDPTTPGRVLASANSFEQEAAGLLRARSTDGGTTWSAAFDALGPAFFGISSPQLACDHFGNCFLGFLDQSTPFSPQLRLSLSTNGGATFVPLAIPNTPGFEPALSVAVGDGSVWVAFKNFDQANALKTIAAPVTGLGALGSFTLQNVPMSTLGDRPDIAIGPGGRALVVTEHIINGSPSHIETRVDPDGLGPAGFGAPWTVTNTIGYPQVATPQVAWDRARNRAYLVYEDQRFGGLSHDVLLRFSTDGATTWSAAIRVNGDGFSLDRMLPNVAVDPATGHVGVAWYDLRAGPDAAQPFGRVFPTVAKPAEPASPVNLRATPVSTSRIDLAWDDRSDNETGFEIRRTTGDPRNPTIETFTVGADVTTFSHTGLAEDSGGVYVVRAFNGAGFSGASNSIGVTTLDSPPAAPQNLVATAVSFQRIDLSWTPVEDADGVEIQQSLDGTSWTSLGRSATNGANAMLFGLQPDTTYFFRVRAFNSGGDGPFSNVASARTLAIPPFAPYGLTATAVSRTEIALAWSDASSNETFFQVERSNGGQGFKVVARPGPNATSFTDTRLKAGTTYTYRVRACNDLGCSLPTNTASATTLRR